MASPLGLTFDVKSTGIPSITGKNKSYKVVNSKVVKSLKDSFQFEFLFLLPLDILAHSGRKV